MSLKQQNSPSKQPLNASDFFSEYSFTEGVIEWGSPHGRVSRLCPALAAKSVGRSCLWLYDHPDLKIHPPAWQNLGLDLNRMHFLNEPRPLQSLKTAITQKTYSFFVLDTRQFLSQGDLSFLTQVARREKVLIFLLRQFFLSNRNGNPFAKYRFNSSFSLKSGRFQISSIKGAHKRYVNMSWDEVLSL